MDRNAIAIPTDGSGSRTEAPETVGLVFGNRGLGSGGASALRAFARATWDCPLLAPDSKESWQEGAPTQYNELRMSGWIRLIGLLAFLAVIVYVVISSFGLSQESCEVCMVFEGRESCRTARAPSQAEAIQAARNNACARITNNRAESIRCSGSEPASITCSD